MCNRHSRSYISGHYLRQFKDSLGSHRTAEFTQFLFKPPFLCGRSRTRLRARP